MRYITCGVAFAVGATVLGCARPPAGPTNAGPPKVTVATPLVRPVTEFTELTGTLAAVKTVDLRARVSGYVQAVLFEEGKEVTAGQELIRIDPQPFRAALAQAQASQQSAAARLEEATANEARQRKLRESGAVSAEEYDQARAALGVARADVASAAAATQQAQLNFDYTTVVAPFAGRIDRMFVNEGTVVTGGTGQGTVLTRVVTVDPIYAYFTVNEQTVLAYLRRAVQHGRTSSQAGGLPVEVRLRDETGYPHKGTIDFASSGLNPTTGSLQIRGTFQNPGPPRLLRPGLFVRGRIPLSTAADATLIPDEAVATDQAQRVVYVLGPENRLVAKPVTLGPQSAGLRVVEGLAPTDRIVIKGLARVQPDTVVEPIPGEIKAVEETPAAAPGGTSQPTAPESDPGAGAAPGAGGNATPGGGARGQPSNAANPQGANGQTSPKGM